MAQDIINPLQSTSYTNKDFSSIYVELLDLVKELTYKWDPSISNESDPGVILLKLNALIADKCNYNIDKNVLECFPLSVTQEKNARQLFSQLGYYMKWYRASSTVISMKWSGKSTPLANYTIPPFTMVSDEDDETIYTLVGPYSSTTPNYIGVGEQKISTKGDSILWNALQGVAIKYDINGQPNIKVRDLDDNNRIYFPDTDIAENGIFICNVGQNNYSDWKRKDNILLEASGTLCYSFGVSDDGLNCFVEFPEDAEDLFKDGINITYIKTSGQLGNVAAQVITKFYANLTPIEDSTIVLNQENVTIKNYMSATTGKDPENINDAYRNYKRTIGTFNTLITLRDYMNAIYTSGLVSNCIVSDRVSDIQSSYKVISDVDGINQTITLTNSKQDGTPELNAFSLKMYLLQYVPQFKDAQAYNASFNLMTNDSLVKSYIEDTKSIQHDYVDILKSTSTVTNTCLFKNKYPLDVTIIPQYALTESQVNEVISNVKIALYEGLNSQEIDFGEEVSLDLVYDIIKTADSRIKSIILDNIEYTTYAVYLDENGNVVETPLNQNHETTFDIESSNTKLEVSVDKDTFVTQVGSNYYQEITFNYTSTWSPSLDTYGVTITSGVPASGDSIKVRVSKATQIQDDIYAKSILAGTTELFDRDKKFDFNLNQDEGTIIDNIESILPEVNKSFTTGTPLQLRKNESIEFLSPNLLEVTSYSNYVKFEYYIPSTDIIKDSNYQLKEDEYILFYWKEEDNASAIYKYACYGKGNIICPTFDISKTPLDGYVPSGAILKTRMTNIGTETNPRLFASSETVGDMSYSTSYLIGLLTSGEYILSGSKSMAIKQMNKLQLDDSYYCYWYLNQTNEDGKFELFHDNETTRYLGSGEYFFYTTNTLSELNILGSGTTITRENTSLPMIVDKINISDILNDGSNALANNWYKNLSNLELIENQFILLGEDCSVLFSLSEKGFEENASYTITSSNTSVVVSNVLNKSKWYSQVGGNNGTYVFTYNDGWYYTGVKIDIADYGISITSGAPATNNTITVVISGAEASGTLTSTVSDLSEFSIKYRASVNDEWSVLVNDDLLNSDGWAGKTILNIDTSPEKSQILYSGQKINYTLENGDTGVINGGDPDDPLTNYPVVILGSIPVVDNGQEVTTILEKDDSTIERLSLYKYKQMVNTTTSSINIKYSNNGEVIITAPTASKSNVAVATFTLNRGNYILPIEISDGVTLNITDTSTSGSSYLTDLRTNEQAHNIGEGKYYLLFEPLHDDSYIKITLSKSATSTEKIITLHKITKFNRFETMDSDYFDKLISLIQQLDKNNSFDYVYDVDDEIEIKNPLLPKSFLNSNHVCNAYTICQLDIPNTSYMVTSRR